jgi:hypothetical protein
MSVTTDAVNREVAARNSKRSKIATLAQNVGHPGWGEPWEG